MDGRSIQKMISCPRDCKHLYPTEEHQTKESLISPHMCRLHRKVLKHENFHPEIVRAEGCTYPEDSVKKYVVGFMFSESLLEVLLILKNKPSWQKGKYNGVGGKIEKFEEPTDSMTREFWEETGVMYDKWDEFLILRGDDWIVHFFRAADEKAFNHARSTTEEKIFRALSMGLPTNVIPNLRWIVPLATHNYEFPIEIRLLEVFDARFGFD